MGRNSVVKPDISQLAHTPAAFTAPLECVPAACFSLSTAVFHVRTISLASSETSFAACERSLPTARPALLSWREDGVSAAAQEITQQRDAL